MPALSPQDWAAKWSKNSANATQEFIRGVQSVTESPMAKAAQRLDVAAQNYQEAVSSGRMAARLNAISTATWQQSTVDKADRYRTGVAGRGAAKYAAYANAVAPTVAQIRQQAKAGKQNGTMSPLQRVEMAINAMRQFAGKPPIS